jgi:hypothetical protein
MRYFFSAAAFLLLVSVAACDGNIEDDWGPPAGYATIQGVVTDSSGAPLTDAVVFRSFCLSKEQDLFPSTDSIALSSSRTFTDDEGQYEMSELLPPVGAFPEYKGETLRLECDMVVGEHLDAARGKASGTVTFYSEEEQKRASTIDITIDE